MDSSEDEGNSVFKIGEDLVPVRERTKVGSLDFDFDGLSKTPLKLEENPTEGCGGLLWIAGKVLGKYLMRQDPSIFKDKSIVELGAGGGLVGLSVALNFDFDQPLYITDQIPMFALMERNIALNCLEGRVKASIYNWGEPVPEGIPQHPDVILAAECVYFEPAFPLLQQTLKDLIGPNTICYFCFKRRRRADMNFVKVIKKMFNVEVVEDDPDKPVWSRENLHMFKITLKKKK